jgi:RNA polymerase sigma factor (sigma-70 family)
MPDNMRAEILYFMFADLYYSRQPAQKKVATFISVNGQLGYMGKTSAGFKRTEEELVHAVLRNDRDAFRELIHRYERLVLQIVCRMVKRIPDQEDLCQEVFLKVFDKLKEYRFEAKLSTWVGRIAFNTCVNFLQKKQLIYIDTSEPDNDEEPRDSLPADSNKQPDELLVQKEEGKLLWKLVEELPAIQQTIISLFHQEQLTMEEIADMLNMPLGTIKSYLHRARTTLKNKLLSQ